MHQLPWNNNKVWESQLSNDLCIEKIPWVISKLIYVLWYLLMYICDYMPITYSYVSKFFWCDRQLQSVIFQIWGLPAVTKVSTSWQHFSHLPSSLSRRLCGPQLWLRLFLAHNTKIWRCNMNWAAPSSISSFHFLLIFSWEVYVAYFPGSTLRVILSEIHDKPVTSLVTSSIAEDLQASAPVIFSSRRSEECKVRIWSGNSSDIWINHTLRQGKYWNMFPLSGF